MTFAPRFHLTCKLARNHIRDYAPREWNTSVARAQYAVPFLNGHDLAR